MTSEPSQLEALGKQAYQNRQYQEAAEYFRQAAEGYTLGRAGLLAAEMRNNLSVALLKAGKPQEALDAALDTDKVFEGANDTKRRAMALGNQAAALEGLQRFAEAIETYERSAELFASINEGDLRASVMKAAAALKLRTGKIAESAFKMMGAVEAKDHPTIFERIVKFFLRLVK
jgi:tetratricopeptide (TPR) repeat protein